MDVFECIFYVSSIQLVFNYIYIRTNKLEIFQVHEDVKMFLILRCVFNFFSDLCLYASFYYISFSKGFCLFFLNTIIYPFLAGNFLEYNLMKIDYLAAVAAGFALLLFCQPFGDEYGRETYGEILGLLSAFFASLTILFMRKVSNQIDFRLPSLYMMILSSVLTPILSLFSQATKVGD